MGNCFSISQTTRRRKVARGDGELFQNITTSHFNMNDFAGGTTVSTSDFAGGNEELLHGYIIKEGISSGPHWVAIKAFRIVDSKEVIIKRISKAKLPPTEAYLPPCMSNETCQCTRCAPTAIRPPLELILLQSKDSTMPEYVCCLEDKDNWFLVTKTHGLSERQFMRIWTWFGSKRFSRVHWSDYLS